MRIIKCNLFHSMNFRRRCRHRDEKDDYIQPVYKRNDPIQDKGQLALANTCSRQQKGACGPSFSPGTGHINRIGGRVVDKPVNENGEGAYYLELKEGSGELIYDSIQETHAVYEQMKDEREDKDPGYAELDSIKCNADGYCVPFTSHTETPANVIKTEHLKESVKCNNDGYCVPFTSRPETPANDNNTVYLKDHVKCNTGEYSVPCIIRQKTPSKIDKAGHLKDSVKYNTDGYSVPFTYGPGLTTHLNKIEHSDAQLSNSKTKLKTENDDYLIPIADKPEVAYN